MNHLPFFFILGVLASSVQICRKISELHHDFSIETLKIKGFSGEFSYLRHKKKKDLNKFLRGEVAINLAAVHGDDITNLEEYYSTNVQGKKSMSSFEEKGSNKIFYKFSCRYILLIGTNENGKINFNEYGRTKALAEDVYQLRKRIRKIEV